MKVLHVIPSVSPLRGGTSSALEMITEASAQAGVENEIATTDDDGIGRLRRVIETERRNGVTYRYFPRQNRFYTVSWPLARWLFQHAADYDVIHIHSIFNFPFVAAARAAMHSHTPYIVAPHGMLNQWGMENRRPWIKNLSFQMLELPLLRRAAAIHYTADQERLEAGQTGVRERAVVIPIPVPSLSDTGPAPGSFRQEYGIDPDRPVVLFLSRIDVKKGLPVLIDAFSAIQQSWNAVLVIAGDGDQVLREDIERRIDALELQKHVIWTGFLRGAKKAAVFADATCFVLPSYSENFGVALVEAMQCGVPVITTYQVALHREIGSAKAGIIGAPEAKAMASALETLLGDPQLRRSMGQNGICLSRERFAPVVVARALRQLYESVLSEQRSYCEIACNEPHV